jgi:hypothetical protein
MSRHTTAATILTSSRTSAALLRPHREPIARVSTPWFLGAAAFGRVLESPTEDAVCLGGRCTCAARPRRLTFKSRGVRLPRPG